MDQVPHHCTSPSDSLEIDVLDEAPAVPDRGDIRFGNEPTALLEPDCVFLPNEEVLTAALREPDCLVILSGIEALPVSQSN